MGLIQSCLRNQEFELTGTEVLEHMRADTANSLELALCSSLDYLPVVEIHRSQVLLLPSSVYVARMHI